VQVSTLYQDSKGYLWSGGYGGLSRFDGKTFLNFNKKKGLIDHNVNAICESDSGDIFVGTNKGLSVLKKNKIINYTGASGLNSQIISLCKGHHHSMYIGSAHGLFMFSNNKIKTVSKLNNYKINCLYKSDTSYLFIGTDSGLVLYGHSTFKLLSVKNGLPSNQINTIVSYKNFIVLGTSKGLSFYNLSTQKFTNYFIENGLIDENITCLLSQDSTDLWIGSQSGLLKYNGEQFYYYNIGFDNNSNIIRCIIKDRENNIWAGTHSGLYKYRDNSFSTFDKINGPGNAFVYQIFRDTKNDLWMCSQNNGIYKYSQGYFKRYGISDGLTSLASSAGLQDKSGRLIFGTDNSVMQLKNERFYSIPLPKNFNGPYSMLYLSSNNTIWIGGLNGICSLIFNGEKPNTKFYPFYKNVNSQVFGFEEDDEKNLWIGTYGQGLLKLKNDSIYAVSKQLKITEENYFSLKYINNLIFAGTLNGLIVFNIKTNGYKYITEQDGLNSELIYAIEFANNKNDLWIGTNQGINKLNLKKYIEENKIEITSYGKQEGFVGVECNSNGIWEDKDNTLWFGTVSGVVMHQPFNLKENRIQNSTIIQTVKLANDDTLFKQNAKLPYYLNSISFYYKGICLTNPDKVLYIKKLEGLEKNWSSPSSEDYSKYANLAPGKYTFKVKSCNNQGVWDENETSFTFTIKSPYYLTWWFILIVISCISLTIYLIFKIRLRSIRKKQKQDFDRKVEMSKIELKALRSQMNPHFIFNSLNSIQHYIFNSKSDEAIKYLNKFARLVRIILNNSDKPTVTVEDDLEALKLYLELEQMRFEGKFDYEIKVDENVDTDYDIMPPLLMQPYVENAILHGLNPKPEKGFLKIHLSFKDNFLICTITDNGIGREKASQIKRTMPGQKHKSLGMKITEDRLRILNEINNSELSVTITDLKDENQNSLGTRVELYVPLIG
jgi:ligand-binding sensor domain-containing protein